MTPLLQAQTPAPPPRPPHRRPAKPAAPQSTAPATRIDRQVATPRSPYRRPTRGGRAPATAPADGGWPRAYATPSGGKMLVYQPQVAEWTDQKHMVAYAAVSWQARTAEKPTLGSIKIEADTKVSTADRLVNFSAAEDHRGELPAGAEGAGPGSHRRDHQSHSRSRTDHRPRSRARERGHEQASSPRRSRASSPIRRRSSTASRPPS